ncbi:hypothetical protein B5X24_HaOG214843 [Helicoverpa armigera]|nr:hypothetical protein B5X24_HaOG214843 [Helicoverpa armigera]
MDKKNENRTTNEKPTKYENVTNKNSTHKMNQASGWLTVSSIPVLLVITADVLSQELPLSTPSPGYPPAGPRMLTN